MQSQYFRPAVLRLCNLQSIQETLVDNGERFWSSEGSSSQEANESLTYQLVGACSRVSTVEITVYKATYQFGYRLPGCSPSIEENRILALLSMPKKETKHGSERIQLPPHEMWVTPWSNAGSQFTHPGKSASLLACMPLT